MEVYVCFVLFYEEMAETLQQVNEHATAIRRHLTKAVSP